ncbi:MAG: peptide-methionine (R)-S-oxide reductase MsrB [Magnetococcales bacterium]|nr:peptide-methionine (R)-S-oxide reductase MsrB [Magnetococcales bacterium]
MNRRHFIRTTLAFGGSVWMGSNLLTSHLEAAAIVDKITKTEDEWRAILTPEQFEVLRKEGTERPHSSPLNKEHRKGIFVCAGCELPLFTSEMKYDSGTGWPSFFAAIEGAVETEWDMKLFYPREEYHCIRCGGHQGHVFKDGPPPTGKRYCNNGLALKFNPSEAS